MSRKNDDKPPGRVITLGSRAMKTSSVGPLTSLEDLARLASSLADVEAASGAKGFVISSLDAMQSGSGPAKSSLQLVRDTKPSEEEGEAGPEAPVHRLPSDGAKRPRSKKPPR